MGIFAPFTSATDGYFLGEVSEARFGNGIGFVRPNGGDPVDGELPNAWGLQRVTNFNPAIHILQFDPRASTGQLAAQVVSHEAMIVNMQAEVVINPA